MRTQGLCQGGSPRPPTVQYWTQGRLPGKIMASLLSLLSAATLRKQQTWISGWSDGLVGKMSILVQIPAATSMHGTVGGGHVSITQPSRQVDAGSWRSVNLDKWLSSGFSERPRVKRTNVESKGRKDLRLTSDLHLSVHLNMHTCAHTVLHESHEPTFAFTVSK